MPAGPSTSTEPPTLRRRDARRRGRPRALRRPGERRARRLVWAGMAEPGEDPLAVGARRPPATRARSPGERGHRRGRRRGRGRPRRLPDRRAAGAARRAAAALPAAAGAGEPCARHPLRQRPRDLPGVPAAGGRRRGCSPRPSGRARRGGLSLIVADRNLRGAAALRGLRVPRGRPRSRSSRRAGRRDSDAWVLMLKPVLFSSG